jgi:hypothetical protein
LTERHVLDVLGGRYLTDTPGVNHPHDDAADQQRGRHEPQALQMLANDLGEQEGGDCGADKGDEREREGMVERGAIAALALWKGPNEFEDAAHKEEDEREDGTELDDDGVHLPVRIGQVDVEQRFGDPQVRGRTDG